MTYKEFIDKLVDYVRQSGDWKVQDLIPRMVFSNKVRTMGTNAHNIFINPNFAASLTMPQVVGVLWHEALHDLYDHHKVPWARYDVSSGLSPQQWHHLTNVAMDLIINDTVLASGQELPPDGIFRDDFPYITDDMTTSHKVFKAMLKHLQEQRQNAGQNFQKGSSSSSSSSTSDDEGEGGQSQEEVVIEISPDDPIAKAMANQIQQEEDDEAIANEPPQSPEDSDDSDDASSSSSSSNSISKEERDEKQSQIDEARQSIDDARNQLEDEEKKLRDRLDELNQDSDDEDDDDEDDDEEDDDFDESDEPEDDEDDEDGLDNSDEGDEEFENDDDDDFTDDEDDNDASEKEDIENKLKELEDRRNELDEKSDELDKMQEELDSLSTDDPEDDDDTYDDSDEDDSLADDQDLDEDDSGEDNEEDSEEDSEEDDDSAEMDDPDESPNDDTPLSELLSDLVEEISTEVLRDLTAVDKTERMPIPALLNAQVTWIDKVFSRVGRYLAQQNRDRTFSRPARRNPYGLPDSEYKTPQKGSVIRDYKPTVCFYLDASGSMYHYYYEDGKRIEISGPEIIRKKLAQRAQLLKDTRSIVIPFSNALGKPIDVTAKFPYEYSSSFVSGTNLNNVINDINKNSFDVSVIITDATETLYVDRISNNRDVVIVLPDDSSISGDTTRRNIEIIQQEDLLK